VWSEVAARRSTVAGGGAAAANSLFLIFCAFSIPLPNLVFRLKIHKKTKSNNLYLEVKEYYLLFLLWICTVLIRVWVSVMREPSACVRVGDVGRCCDVLGSVLRRVLVTGFVMLCNVGWL
jgi:hypothetical protein